MTQSGTTGFIGRLADDFRSARRYLAARSAIRKLAARRSELESQWQAAGREGSESAKTVRQAIWETQAKLAEASVAAQADKGQARRFALVAGGGVVGLLAVIVAGVVLAWAAAAPGVRTEDAGTPGRRDAGTKPQSPPAVVAASPRPGVPASSLDAAALEALCRQRLADLADRVGVYRMIHNGANPAKLSDLYYDGLVRDLSDFVYPAATGTDSLPAAKDLDAKGAFTLDGLPGQPVAGIVVREKQPHYAAAEVLAAMDNDTVQFVPFTGQPPSGSASPTTAPSSR